MNKYKIGDIVKIGDHYDTIGVGTVVDVRPVSSWSYSSWYEYYVRFHEDQYLSNKWYKESYLFVDRSTKLDTLLNE